jgi:hypothetical protein
MKKLLNISSVLALVVGVGLIVGSIWGMCFTYRSIARENIVTPADASIASTPVRGPFTLKAQADIIREHMLTMAGGKTYAEMSREDTNRATWITATSLTTALNLGILAYALCGLTLLFGFFLLLVAGIMRAFAKRTSFV